MTQTEAVRFLTISEFARRIGVSMQTLRNWHRDGKLCPHHVTPTGHRMYTEEQVTTYFTVNAGRPAVPDIGKFSV